MRQKKGFTLIELLAIIVILAAIALIIAPVLVHVIDNVKGDARTETANRILHAAKYFYATSSIDQNIIYPSEGLEFVCNGIVCQATIGETTEDSGISMLTSEEPIIYLLEFSGKVPSSGSILVYSDGSVTPKNLAVDSHICIYNEIEKAFISC